MIITNNEEALRVTCDDVKEDEVGSIIQQLENELKFSADRGVIGIGLAAPQIGIAKNIAIVRLGAQVINLINPKIRHMYDPAMFESEGCLSFPGRVEKTMRYREISVDNGIHKDMSFIATGLLAVVAQHEIDHLSGVLLPDVAIKDNIIKHVQKQKPNDLCLCGSGKKYKKCCRV